MNQRFHNDPSIEEINFEISDFITIGRQRNIEENDLDSVDFTMKTNYRRKLF